MRKKRIFLLFEILKNDRCRVIFFVFSSLSLYLLDATSLGLQSLAYSIDTSLLIILGRN